MNRFKQMLARVVFAAAGTCALQVNALPFSQDLVMDLSAANLSGFSDGDRVTLWPDTSGQGNDMTASSSGPVYRVIGGNPALEFNGGSSMDDGNGVQGIGATYTKFMRLTYINFNRPHPVPWSYTGATYVHAPYNRNGAHNLTYLSSRGGPRPAYPFQVGETYDLIWTENGSHATLYVNDTLVGHYTGGSAPNLGGRKLTLEAYGDPLAAHVEAFAVYNRALTPQEIEQVRADLGGGSGGTGLPPIAHYKADNDTSEESATHPGEWGNSVYGFSGAETYTAGVDGSAFLFSGAGANTNSSASFVTVQSLSNVDLGGGSFSMGIWANPNGCPSGECQLASTSTHGVPYGWELRMHGTNTIFTYKLTTGQQHTVSTSIPFNQWSHVTITWDATAKVASIYRNGALSNTRAETVGIRLNQAAKLVFGENNNWLGSAGHGPYRGALDNICVFDVALSDEQSLSLSNDTSGCNTGTSGPIDSDGDGVSDDDDACPDTPSGASVNADGCAPSQLDTDGDGVMDDADICPGTEAGADVDAAGCSAAQRDTDNDGLSDADDNCPLTANTDQADLDGDDIGDVCDPDVDGDGVANDADQCPATGSDSVVNDNGCSVSDLCPCEAARTHGQHVSCVSQTTKQFERDDLMTKTERKNAVKAAAKSSCGKK